MTLDLTQDVPRSPFDTLDGYAWLPRLIDKTRAFYAGTHGEYSAYPCPGDRGFLGFFGLDAEALGAVIKGGATDAEIAAWVRQHTRRTDAEAATFARGLETPPRNPLLQLVLVVMRWRLATRLRPQHPTYDFNQLDAIPKLLAFEEGHPVPGR